MGTANVLSLFLAFSTIILFPPRKYVKPSPFFFWINGDMEDTSICRNRLSDLPSEAPTYSTISPRMYAAPKSSIQKAKTANNVKPAICTKRRDAFSGNRDFAKAGYREAIPMR